MQRMRMRDVAAAVGVSTMTVSRALRQDGRISPQTRKRILEAVARLGYVPDRIAGGFSSRKSGFVGLLVPSLNNVHFAETVAGLQAELHPAGLQLLLGHTNYDRILTERLVETMLERRPEAMVLTYDAHTDRTRQLLVDSRIPVIEAWELPRRPIGHAVGFSNRKAAASVARHLIDLGARRIGFIGESSDEGTRGAERRRGFIDALKAAGLDPKRQIALVPPPIGMLQGREAMKALLARWPDTEAVLCVSDPAAYGALTACQLAKIAVPRQIAIAGFGGFEISRVAIPPITTISISGAEIGSNCGALVKQVLGGECRRSARREVAVTLCVRESTAGGAST